MQAFSDRGSYVAWNLGGIAATVESFGLAAPDAREQEKKEPDSNKDDFKGACGLGERVRLSLSLGRNDRGF